MKIFVGVIAYNEEIFIEASLRSLYEYVDKIIVVDGSYWGPSEDKTVEIARSIGPKVEVISGTWRWHGTDHKHIQRSQYLSMMPKGLDNWCILHDADEVWDKENIKRLVNYLQEADERTMLFSYQWIHLFNDPWHKIHGTQWSMPRSVGTFRLVEGIRQFNHHMVGVGDVNFQKLHYPERVILEDVMFYHYGQAASNSNHIIIFCEMQDSGEVINWMNGSDIGRKFLSLIGKRG